MHCAALARQRQEAKARGSATRASSRRQPQEGHARLRRRCAVMLSSPLAQHELKQLLVISIRGRKSCAVLRTLGCLLSAERGSGGKVLVAMAGQDEKRGRLPPPNRPLLHDTGLPLLRIIASGKLKCSLVQA